MRAARFNLMLLLEPADHDRHRRAYDEDGDVTDEVYQTVGDIEGHCEDDDKENGHLDQQPDTDNHGQPDVQ